MWPRRFFSGPFARHARLLHAVVGDPVDRGQQVTPAVVDALQELAGRPPAADAFRLSYSMLCSFCASGTSLIVLRRTVVQHDKRRQRDAQTGRRIVALSSTLMIGVGDGGKRNRADAAIPGGHGIAGERSARSAQLDAAISRWRAVAGRDSVGRGAERAAGRLRERR